MVRFAGRQAKKYHDNGNRGPIVKFNEILEKAQVSWKTLDKAEKPQILVGAGTCGRAAGALEIIEVINAELTRLGIDADVTEVGCIGICYAEPLVDIIKPGQPRICYSNVTPDMVRDLLEAYLVNDDPKPELAMGAFGDKAIDSIPRFWEQPMLKPQVRIALRNCGIIDPGKNRPLYRPRRLLRTPQGPQLQAATGHR